VQGNDEKRMELSVFGRKLPFFGRIYTLLQEKMTREVDYKSLQDCCNLDAFAILTFQQS
jgi:hypothetical protein